MGERVIDSEVVVHRCTDCGYWEGERPQAGCCPNCGSSSGSQPYVVRVVRRKERADG